MINIVTYCACFFWQWGVWQTLLRVLGGSWGPSRQGGDPQRQPPCQPCPASSRCTAALDPMPQSALPTAQDKQPFMMTFSRQPCARRSLARHCPASSRYTAAADPAPQSSLPTAQDKQPFMMTSSRQPFAIRSLAPPAVAAVIFRIQRLDLLCQMHRTSNWGMITSS